MKFILVAILSLFALWLMNIYYNVVISGNYYLEAPWYHTVFLTTLLLGILYGIFKFGQFLLKMKRFNLFVFVPISLLGLLMIEGCTYAKSNQIVLYSEDCGVNWKQVGMGSRVPASAGNPCFIKETMPGYEMQGDMDFYVLFKDQVKVRMRLSYSYLINDPILFMKVAKKLGKSNSNADDAQDDNERFEGAENRVIEIKIKKVASDEFTKEDVVSHNINDLEIKYLDLVNEELKDRGVKIATFEMVPDFQPLTQQAIDAANADRIYSAKNMQEFGRQITIARAGANQIVINDK